MYVKLKPYRQTSLAPAYTKLSKRYYGLFQVEEHIGQVAYRLQLSVSTRIHPVFHISLLKLHQGHLPETLAPLPPTATNHLPVIEPLSILD